MKHVQFVRQIALRKKTVNRKKKLSSCVNVNKKYTSCLAYGFSGHYHSLIRRGDEQLSTFFRKQVE